jgi:hypothetical protein
MQPKHRERAERAISETGDAVDRAIYAIEALMRIYQLERMLYLLVAVASAALFVYATILLFQQRTFAVGTAVAVLGGSGLATAASARIGYFFNKGFALIDKAITAITSSGAVNGSD